MGCCGDREKGLTVTEEQKWDYIVRGELDGAASVFADFARPFLTSSRRPV